MRRNGCKIEFQKARFQKEKIKVFGFMALTKIQEKLAVYS